jgi:hypothetical protein
MSSNCSVVQVVKLYVDYEKQKKHSKLFDCPFSEFLTVTDPQFFFLFKDLIWFEIKICIF